MARDHHDIRADARDPLGIAGRYGQAFRHAARPLAAAASAEDLRRRFCLPLAAAGRDPATVIDELIAAAEPGLVCTTDPNFFAWVIGGSDPVGVAADWLGAVWGQNAAIYQSSPAAAVAEEAVESWLLDLLDLPRESSVGFVSGATTAAFVGLAAARTEVLARHGHDFEADGLQGAPLVRIYLSDDAHVTNFAALRQLGFAEANFHRIPSDAAGLVRPEDLAAAMATHDGPKIVIAQAGHINSGGFEPLAEIAAIAGAHRAWMHVDGAFGLWVRATPRRKDLAAGAECADSWSVDGHKWLQIPYDSGFAIVRSRDAHRRAMRKSAGYLNMAPDDGRSPSDYVPGLSRRAHGFAAWAVLRGLGRDGVSALVDRHCDAARFLAGRIRGVDGLSLLNRVELNQIVVGCDDAGNGAEKIGALADSLNAQRRFFVRTAVWKRRTVLRISVISRESEWRHASDLADAIETAWAAIEAAHPAVPRPRPA